MNGFKLLASYVYKSQKGDVAGLEKAINCRNTDFDLFVEELKKYTFIEAGSVEIVIGNLLKQGK